MRAIVIRILAFSLLTLNAPAFASEMQFIPLQQYLSKSGIQRDPAALGYVAGRCSALYTAFAKNLQPETDPERKKLEAKFEREGEIFMDIATKMLMVGTTRDLRDALERTRNTVTDLGKIYIARVDRARNLSNNLFSDSLIAGDFATCNSLSSQLK